MTMEVLLMTDVPGLGSEGDIVKVADGYGRNYLLPRDLAAPVTEATRRRLQKMREEREARQKEEIESARAMAAKLANASCTIPVKVGEEEQMYGSVTTSDIVESLQSQDIELDRHSLVMDGPIRELGVYDVAVRLHPEVEATVKVWVVEE